MHILGKLAYFLQRPFQYYVNKVMVVVVVVVVVNKTTKTLLAL